MESNTPLKNDIPHKPSIKILMIGFVALVIIIAAYGIYFYMRHKTPKVPEKLTPEQEQVIMQQLNVYAEQNPLPENERSQLVTGKPATKSATSTKR